MDKTVTIYALVDPRDPFRVRYVGKSRDPSKRLRQHITQRNRHKSHKNNWVNALIGESIKPVVIGIQDCSVEEWEKWERFWITHFKGCGLVNSTEGGDVVCDQTGYRHTPEAREKIRLAGIGRRLTREVIDGMRRRRLGMKLPAAWVENIRRSKQGVKFPAIALQRAIAANTGRKRSPETCAKIGAVHRGKTVPEHVTRMFFVPVRCIETGEVFESVKAASLSTGIGRTNITQTLRKANKTAGGYHWERISNG